MRMNKGGTGLRIAVIALGLVAWTATGATAAPILKYTTAVQLDSEGRSGPNVISFLPARGQGIELAGRDNAALGTFVVAPNPSGTTTIYNNTKFSITFLPQSYGERVLSNLSPLVLTGRLNGQVSGMYRSTVEATFDPVPENLIALGNGVSTQLSIVENPKLLVPSSSNDGETTLQAQLTTLGVNPEAPIPEPSTVALFLSTIGGLGLRRYVLARRRGAEV